MRRRSTWTLLFTTTGASTTLLMDCNNGTSIVCAVWISSWDTVFGSFTNCSTISVTGASGICSTTLCMVWSWLSQGSTTCSSIRSEMCSRDPHHGVLQPRCSATMTVGFVRALLCKRLEPHGHGQCRLKTGVHNSKQAYDYW